MLVGNFQSYVPQYGGGFAPTGGPSPYQQAGPAFGAYGGGGGGSGSSGGVILPLAAGAFALAVLARRMKLL